MIYCMKCEAANGESARFCTRCGASFATDAFCETCGGRCSPQGVCMSCYREFASRREATEAADRQRAIKGRAWTLAVLGGGSATASILLIASNDRNLAPLAVLFGIVGAALLLVLFGGMPGAIARGRSHPSAAAIAVLGWFGVATFGLLWLVALVWAHTAPDPARRR